MSYEARHRVKGVRGICAGVTGAGHQYSGDGGCGADERIETERGLAGAGSRSGVTVFML